MFVRKIKINNMFGIKNEYVFDFKIETKEARQEIKKKLFKKVNNKVFNPIISIYDNYEMDLDSLFNAVFQVLSFYSKNDDRKKVINDILNKVVHKSYKKYIGVWKKIISNKEFYNNFFKVFESEMALNCFFNSIFKGVNETWNSEEYEEFDVELIEIEGEERKQEINNFLFDLIESTIEELEHRIVYQMHGYKTIKEEPSFFEIELYDKTIGSFIVCHKEGKTIKYDSLIKIKFNKIVDENNESTMDAVFMVNSFIELCTNVWNPSFYNVEYKKQNWPNKFLDELNNLYLTMGKEDFINFAKFLNQDIEDVNVEMPDLNLNEVTNNSSIILKNMKFDFICKDYSFSYAKFYSYENDIFNILITIVNALKVYSKGIIIIKNLGKYFDGEVWNIVKEIMKTLISDFQIQFVFYSKNINLATNNLTNKQIYFDDNESDKSKVEEILNSQNQDIKYKINPIKLGKQIGKEFVLKYKEQETFN